jgi:flagellar hook-length control protein FliK
MDVNLLLGVFPAASAKASAGQAFAASQGAAEAGPSPAADRTALAGAFRSLVDELMSSDIADDAPVPGAAASSESDDLDELSETAPDAATDWPMESRRSQRQVWLVELEILNRTPAAASDLPRSAVDDVEPGPTDATAAHSSVDENDTLAAMLGVVPAQAPNAAAAPIPTESTESSTDANSMADDPSTTTATPDHRADVRGRRDSELAVRAGAEPPTSNAPSTQGDESRAERTRRTSSIGGQTTSPVPAQGGPSRSAAADALDTVDTLASTDDRPAASLGSFESGLSAQRPGVAQPEGATPHAAPGNASQRAGQPLASGDVPREHAPRVNVRETYLGRGPAIAESIDSTPAASPVAARGHVNAAVEPETRAALAAGASSRHTPFGDTPQKQRQSEPHVAFVRPMPADAQALGMLASGSGSLDAHFARAVSAQPAVSLSAPAVTLSALPEPTAQQIVQSIRLVATRGGGEATIRLDPKHFGEVSISVRVDQGQVTARVQAESPVVREYLQSHQGLLRDSLSDQQLTLTKLDVAEPPADSRNGERRSSEERAAAEERHAQRRRQPAPHAPFEPFEVVA